MGDPTTCQEMVKGVIDKDLCVLCGACVGLCPYFIAYNGRIVMRDVCDLPQGRCITFCPRISLDLERLNNAFYGMSYSWNGLGTVKSVFMARSTDADVEARAQDAGTVTSLLCFAKDEGYIDSAILTSFQDKSLPRGLVASTRDQIMACAGSSYTAAPTLEAFNGIVSNTDHQKIGVVGTPCQTTALAKMKASTSEKENPSDKLRLIIGLFCTWSLAHPGFTRFIEKEVSDPIVKYNIPPHPAEILQVYTGKKRIDIPLDKILPFVRPACRVCHDLTAEFADISVGGGRGELSEWNTVIVRTPRGLEIVNGAIKKGVIETTEIPKENLSRLETASNNKKKRAVKNIMEKTGSINDLLYLNVQPESISQLFPKSKSKFIHR